MQAENGVPANINTRLKCWNLSDRFTIYNIYV